MGASIPFSDLDERALKTMTGELVSACGGGSAVSTLLASFTPNGRPYSEGRLSAFSNMSDMTRSMPIRAVVKLEIAAGVPIVSGWMAERVTRAPATTAAEACHSDLRRFIREAGDVSNTFVDAMADGKVDSAERAALRADITDLELVLRDLRAKVEQP